MHRIIYYRMMGFRNYLEPVKYFRHGTWNIFSPWKIFSEHILHLVTVTAPFHCVISESIYHLFMHKYIEHQKKIGFREFVFNWMVILTVQLDGINYICNWKYCSHLFGFSFLAVSSYPVEHHYIMSNWNTIWALKF